MVSDSWERVKRKKKGGGNTSSTRPVPRPADFTVDSQEWAVTRRWVPVFKLASNLHANERHGRSEYQYLHFVLRVCCDTLAPSYSVQFGPFSYQADIAHAHVATMKISFTDNPNSWWVRANLSMKWVVRRKCMEQRGKWKCCEMRDKPASHKRFGCACIWVARLTHCSFALN